MNIDVLPRIGLSCCINHRDPQRAYFKDKTLIYAEESLVHWVMEHHALCYLLPTFSPQNPNISAAQLLQDMDALIVQGGADVAPESYGETAEDERWQGDAVRDAYEISLIHEAIKQKKPILGICRGMQIINVALGGSLYQDIDSALSHASCHYNWEQYEKLNHSVSFTKGGCLATLYSDQPHAKVNSIHHQAVKELGKGLSIEAESSDGIVEAFSNFSTEKKTEPPILGVQWHPEFTDAALINSSLLIQFFLDLVKKKA